MMFCVVTPTDNLVYTDNEMTAQDATKAAAHAVRIAAAQAWIEARPGLKWSTLAGAALIGWNSVKASLKTAGKAAVVSHVVQRGSTGSIGSQVPTYIPMAAATYIAQWDGVAPAITTLFGTFPGSLPFCGWPQTDVMPDPPVPPTQAKIDVAIAAAAAKLALQDAWRAAAAIQMQPGIPAYTAWLALNPYP